MTSPPKRVGGRYRLDEPIGRGGMATVYRGHDEQLGRPVAIKVMSADLGEDPQFVRRFEAEARRAASVSHPNVVAVYDVGTSGGAPYIVMELVDGGDLAAALRSGPLDPDRAAAIAIDVTKALEAAHGAGLVHRDVKPGNILLGADGRSRVADFGIARATGEESLTRTGAMLGSVEYFSPEQARGERATPASDLYGLGVVLYELLTARRPFRGDSPYAVATARLRQPAPDPRDVAGSVPEGLASIVTRAMALDPRDRFASAAEMRAALEVWGDGRQPAAPAAAAGQAQSPAVPAVAGPSSRTSAPSAPPPRRPRDRERRFPMAAALAALVLLVGAGLVGMTLLGDDTLDVPDIGNAIDVVAGTPGGEVEEPEPTEGADQSPTAEPAESPEPTRSPAPTPAPTAPPTAPDTPIAVARAGSPDDAVAAFYAAVVDSRFDEAYALWSDRMQATYPRQENLDDRFAQTASITFSELRVASQSATSATVQANFRETYDSGSSRDFIGYWRLVRTDGGWLLDEPNY